LQSKLREAMRLIYVVCWTIGPASNGVFYKPNLNKTKLCPVLSCFLLAIYLNGKMGLLSLIIFGKMYKNIGNNSSFFCIGDNVDLIIIIGLSYFIC